MIEGYATVLEADALLADELGFIFDEWNTVPAGTALTGQYQTGASLDKLSGTGTSADTELSVGDILHLGDYATARVQTIDSPTEVTLESDISEISENTTLYKLTIEKAASMASVLTKKGKALTSAYRRILRSDDLSIPDSPTEEQKAEIAKAQIYFAAHLYYDPEENRHIENQRMGIKSESVGDAQVTYGSAADPFPPGVKALLQSFSLRYRPTRVERR